MSAISRLDWTFLYAPQKSAFITTDNPFILLAEDDEAVYGLLTRGVKKIFPLSAKVCLVMDGFNNSINIKILNRKAVKLINEELASQSIRFIIARDEALLSHIIKAVQFNKFIFRGE